jgi:glucose-6-phosphate 1-dehydrogenase
MRAPLLGPATPLRPAHTTLCYADFYKEAPIVGYDSLLYGCRVGAATLFRRADGIEAG